jgi:hypothetical protein
MSSGHRWCGTVGQTQNQGNQLGDRPCVRQSENYRKHLGGNSVKQMLGQDNLCWDTKNQQGAYAGKPVWSQDMATGNGKQISAASQQQQQQQFQQPQFQQQQLQQQQQQFVAAAASSTNSRAEQTRKLQDAVASAPLQQQQPVNRRFTGRANQSSISFG